MSAPKGMAHGVLGLFCCERVGRSPCSVQICRHYTIDFPPNLPTSGGKSAQDGGKFSACIGEGNGLHRAQKVLTSAAERPYIADKTGARRARACLKERNGKKYAVVIDEVHSSQIFIAHTAESIMPDTIPITVDYGIMCAYEK